MALLKSTKLPGGVVVSSAYWMIDTPPSKLNSSPAVHMAGFASQAVRAQYQAAFDTFKTKLAAAVETLAALEAKLPTQEELAALAKHQAEQELSEAEQAAFDSLEAKVAASVALRASELTARQERDAAVNALRSPDIQPIKSVQVYVPPNAVDGLFTDGNPDGAKIYPWLKTLPEWSDAEDA